MQKREFTSDLSTSRFMVSLFVILHYTIFLLPVLETLITENIYNQLKIDSEVRGMLNIILENIDRMKIQKNID